MSLLKIITSIAFLSLIGGFIFFAVTDVPVPQKTMTQTLDLEGDKNAPL